MQINFVLKTRKISLLDGKTPSTHRWGHVQADSKWRSRYMPAAGGATQPPDKRRATSIIPIPQTLTFSSADRHFGQSLSLACNSRALCAPPFQTQARTYFTAHFKLMGVQGDTSPQGHHFLVCLPRNVTAHKTAISANVFSNHATKC